MADRNFAAGIRSRSGAVTAWSGRCARVGAAGDNAAMESFFALLQRNVLDRQRWVTCEQLRVAIVTGAPPACGKRIARTYHRWKRQLPLAD